ncbi:MAG: prepilin-type N-terminal cleavage/methylation domain-containing protein [Rickettsiales bacterium]|nr:prepilin-type N-terminal cleavage/methylation domain-containing protein [Rickettsiales bacterium]
MNSLDEARLSSYKELRKGYSKEKGFTLVELSIVLIIISLIVSGVFVGQSLIEGAKLRSTVTQLGEYNTALNTFELRYNGLPGDVNGAALGLTGSGNRDGLLLGGGTTQANAAGEPTRFWAHLTEANLIPGNFEELAAGGAQAIGVNFPESQLGANGIAVWGSTTTGINYYQIGAVNGSSNDVHTFSNLTLSVIEAFNLDEKLDNGIPDTGIAGATGGTSPANALSPDATCVDTSGAWVFATNGRICPLRIDMVNF